MPGAVPMAQAIPGAGVDHDLYTVSAPLTGTGTEVVTVLSNLTVCNQAGATTYRIWVAVDGAVTTAAQYLVYDAPLAANEARGFNFGHILLAGDVVRVRSASGSVSFNATFDVRVPDA